MWIWILDLRPSYTHPSVHQTHVGKSLFEHAQNFATIAAVASSSSSIMRSSLGPNLLKLINVDESSKKFWKDVMIPFNPQMKFSQKFRSYCRLENNMITQMIQTMGGTDHDESSSSSSIFAKSLQQLDVRCDLLPLFEGFTALKSITLHCHADSELGSILTTMPSLVEINLQTWELFNDDFFQSIGDLEALPNLRTLIMERPDVGDWVQEAFDEHFCGRLLAKGQLTTLRFDSWHLVEDPDALLTKADLSNLRELGDGFPASWIITGFDNNNNTDNFKNLVTLKTMVDSDEELIAVLNHCLLLETLEFMGDEHVTGSFLASDQLAENALKKLRALKIFHGVSLRDEDIADGFSRLPALTELSLQNIPKFDGSALRSLPNPQNLLTVSVSDLRKNGASSKLFSNIASVATNLRSFTATRWNDEGRPLLPALAPLKKLETLLLDVASPFGDTPESIAELLSGLDHLRSFALYHNGQQSWSYGDVDLVLSKASSRVLESFICADQLIEEDHEFEQEFNYDVFDSAAPPTDDQLVAKALNRKYPFVFIRGEFDVEESKTAEILSEIQGESLSSSGSRREREE